MESNPEPGAFEAAVVLFQLVDNFCLKVSGELQLDNIIYCMLEPFGMVQVLFSVFARLSSFSRTVKFDVVVMTIVVVYRRTADACNL